MGLPRAIQAHKAKKLDEALHEYERAYVQNINDPVLYQNYGSLLKSYGKIEDAQKVYAKGLELFPNNVGILNNYGNLDRNVRPYHSLELYFRALHILLSRDLNKSDVLQLQTAYSCVLDGLRTLGYYQWCISVLKIAIKHVGLCAGFLKTFLLLLDSDKLPLSSDDKELVIATVESKLNDTGVEEAASLEFALSHHYRLEGDFAKSLQYYDQAVQRINNTKPVDVEQRDRLQVLIDGQSWNYGCSLLQNQQFKKGWKLFEFGLRTPAIGAQRWQRALVKLYSSNEIPLWRGETGKGKKILLLEEQAIGDVMMFASLLSSLIEEFNFVALYTSIRLEPIFSRSYFNEISRGNFAVYTKTDASNGVILPSSFDYQSPIGSICQYRFSTAKSYAPLVPCLKSSSSLTHELREKYLSCDKQDPIIVGISWRGGGRGPRIGQKSLDIDLVTDILLNAPTYVRFIDLQYGNTSSQINDWLSLGLDIVHDSSINPLQDMDSWLSQVDACDAVLSVANTTIHGSGGLNKPTMCLLSDHYDWRWLGTQSVKRSYWYPSVGIARQNGQKDWESAREIVKVWLEARCPYPTGTMYTE